MKLHIFAGLMASCFGAAAFAQDAPVPENVSNSRATTLSIISAAPVLEYSNSRDTDIVSYFNRNTWMQATTAGEEIWRGQISITRDGKVCMGGGNCFQVEQVSDGWYMVGPSGLRSNEKHMRYVIQN